MNIGMLWLDADEKRPFEEKVGRAVDYYREKYGRVPELCFVNPLAQPVEESRVGEVLVKSTQTVLRHHFWLGMNPSG